MPTRKVMVVLGLIILFLAVGFIILEQLPIKDKISAGEKELIEAWIIKNDLNQYGDPKDTVYTGGTPLFDEKTGEQINKYDYILRNYPDRPWLK